MSGAGSSVSAGFTALTIVSATFPVLVRNLLATKYSTSEAFQSSSIWYDNGPHPHPHPQQQQHDLRPQLRKLYNQVRSHSRAMIGPYQRSKRFLLITQV